ncbi:MAG: Pycsar system effector family protein [Mucilaginibacter sp.]
MQQENLPGKETDDLATARPTDQNALGSYTSQLKKNKHHLRAVQTMFKSSSSNHQRLSVMADNKAFIMITVNSIIISVAIGLFIGKFVDRPHLIWPTVLLLLVNIAAIIYSVLATRPNIPKGTFTRDDVDQKRVNLLFFGSYYKMELKEFDYGIKQMMDDNEFLYDTLIKDIYWQGKILGRKFRLLRISYDIFMYGIAASVAGYVLALLF